MSPASSSTAVNADEHLEQHEELHLPLKGSATDRFGDGLVGLLAALAQYGFAGFFLAIALKPSAYGTKPALDARLIGLAFAIAIYAFGRWGRRRIRRAVRRDQLLTVMSDRLIIRHGALLTAPVTIRRECVELVAVDDGRPPADSGHRFGIATTDGARWAWLWKRGRGSLPLLDLTGRPPNVLLRFTEAIDFPARRRRLDRRHPLPGSKELGLLMAVADPRAAARAFGAWGIVRPLVSADLAWVPPG